LLRNERPPSPREWEMLSRQFTADEALKISNELIEAAKRKEAQAEAQP
jgi:hypothetical protein